MKEQNIVPWLAWQDDNPDPGGPSVPPGPPPGR